MRILVLSISLFVSFCGFSQELQLLELSEGATSSFTFAGIEMSTKGLKHRTAEEFTCQVRGSRQEVSVEGLMISNIDFTSALLEIYFTNCPESDHYEEGEGEAFFVSIGFYDKDSSYVFGHSFVSEEGFSLSGARSDLQATKLSILNDGEGCFYYTGKAELAIHQAFLYGPDETASDVKKIKYVTVEVSHLGAG